MKSSLLALLAMAAVSRPLRQWDGPVVSGDRIFLTTAVPAEGEARLKGHALRVGKLLFAIDSRS